MTSKCEDVLRDFENFLSSILSLPIEEQASNTKAKLNSMLVEVSDSTM